jgi:hypothetical protein
VESHHEQHPLGNICVHGCWLARLVLSRGNEACRPWLETQAGVRFRLILALGDLDSGIAVGWRRHTALQNPDGVTRQSGLRKTRAFVGRHDTRERRRPTSEGSDGSRGTNAADQSQRLAEAGDSRLVRSRNIYSGADC